MRNVMPQIRKALNTFSFSPSGMLYRFRDVLHSRCNVNAPPSYRTNRLHYTWEGLLTLAGPAVWEALA